MTQLPASQASASLASWQWSLPHGLINDVRVVSCCMSDVCSRWHEWRVQTPTPKPAVPPEASRLAREWPAHDFAQKILRQADTSQTTAALGLSNGTVSHALSFPLLEVSQRKQCHNMSQLFIPSSRSGTTERTNATPPPGGGRSTAPLSVGPSLRSPTFTTRNISQHKTW